MIDEDVAEQTVIECANLIIDRHTKRVDMVLVLALLDRSFQVMWTQEIGEQINDKKI